jgi:protease II
MRLILLSLLILGNLYSSFSQEITGTIKNTNGEPLPDASIYLLDSKVGTTSNKKGGFHLKILKEIIYPKLDTIVVSYVGYDTYKKAVNLKIVNQKNHIILENSLTQLKEFEVKVLTPYSPEKIIKLAIKKTKKNYSQDYTLSNGFYRELIKEEENWIELNEAAIQLKYVSYPQKGFLNQAFHAYYKYDHLPWNRSPSSPFINMLRFTSFLPLHKDQVYLVSSRISLNHGKYGKEVSPVGGPGDLVALDKIKYRYDFFDPKLMKQYTYKLRREAYYNGEKCYVVDFHPNKSNKKRIFQSLSKKMKYPIYSGRIYIAAKTFAVVHFQFQLSKNIDLSIYIGSGGYGIPDFIKVSVDYKKYAGRWMLNTVNTEQRKNKLIGNKEVSYTCLRTLKLEEPQEKKVTFNTDSIAYLTKSIQLRYFYNKYNEEFWGKYEKTKSYPPLSKKIKADLEKTTPLAKQFLSLNLPVDSVKFPIAKKVAHQHIYPIDTLLDNYHWLSNKDSAAVLNYLKAENTYYNDVIFKLSDSIKGFYFRYNNTFKPYVDTTKTGNYFTLNNLKCRYKKAENGNVGLYNVLNDNTDELILDRTQAGKGKVNFWIENTQLNTKQQFAYTYSERGAITKTLVVSAFGSNHPIDSISNVYEFTWLTDTTILYTKTDAAGRSLELRAYDLNTKTNSLLYEEKDQTFDVSIKRATSGSYIFIVVENMDEREYYYINYNENRITLNPIVKRLENHNYIIDHKQGHKFYGITNKTKGKFEIVEFPVNQPSIENWKTLYATTNPIEDFYITKDYIAIQEYDKTTLSLKYVHKATKKVSQMEFSDEIFSFYFNKRKSDTSNTLQIDYESPKTAYTTYIIDLATAHKAITAQEVFKFDKKTYKVEVSTALSKDTIKIPITLFYDEALIKDGVKGIILKSYGAYGAKYYPEFSRADKMYVDGGFIIAFAHIRGGGELGEEWYKSGKLFNKVNTFEDYVACAKYLTQAYKIKPKQLVGYGLSAGGLIMGYVANNYPALFGTLIFDRPYLDVINTMMDSSLALTTMEYDEWGNPNDSVNYHYIKSYSPYQNIKKQAYPNMLFFSGYHDEQTPYWQIVKSVAKYRANNTSKSLILLNTDLNAGHRGSTSFSANTNKLGGKIGLIQYALKK